MRTAGFQAPQGLNKTPKSSVNSQKRTRCTPHYRILLRKDKSPKPVRLRCTRICARRSRGKQQGIQLIEQKNLNTISSTHWKTQSHNANSSPNWKVLLHTQFVGEHKDLQSGLRGLELSRHKTSCNQTAKVPLY